MKMAEDTATIEPERTEEKAETPRKEYSFKLETAPPEDLARRFLEAFAVILKNTNYRSMLDAYSRMEMRCGRCGEMCHVYLASGDPRDMPCRRTGLLCSIYERYFTMSGAPKTMLFPETGVSDAEIDELVDSFYRCSMCRRCTLECPAGIDHALITRLGRYILSEIRLIPKTLQVAVRNQLEGGHRNITGLSKAALDDTLEFLEEDIEEMTGRKIKFPLGKKDVDYVFFPPVTDFMTEAETLMGHAAVMHSMGLADNWTIGDINYEAKNYGFYYSDWIYERIMKEMIAEAKRLNGKYIVIGECGHATRAARIGARQWGGATPPVVINSIELLYDGVKSGKIVLDPNTVKEKVTYHDPCNIARNSGIITQPRYILDKFVKNFVELRPNRAYNFCCGGGPASMDDMHDFRMEVAGRKKAEQLKASGADIVVTPCANCKKQISELIRHYKLEMQRSGLHELVLKAMVWG